MLNCESATTKRELVRRPSFSSSRVEQEMVDARIKQEKLQNDAILESIENGTNNAKVLYGQIIQLRHVATGKFLKANTVTASCEKDCLKSSLDDVDEFCHFRIMPR
jgi:hypothetical protein|tara:strand:- start:75 stop:392 length:318 start_codon:yes stop_codon:yes gene_type:complete